MIKYIFAIGVQLAGMRPHMQISTRVINLWYGNVSYDLKKNIVFRLMKRCITDGRDWKMADNEKRK